jgi:mannosyltransferase OCH1-like enzyme
MAVIPFVSQIFLTDDNRCDLPVKLRSFVDAVCRAFPQCKHTVYNNATLRSFIAEHYEDAVLAAYDMLRPYSYKADLGRYCLLNVIGGWYFDIAVKVLTGIVVGEDLEFLAFRDRQKFTGTTWSCQTAVLYSRPKSNVLRTAIDLVVKNCSENYYGITSLCPTGPTLLGEALAINRGNPRHMFGDFVDLTPTHEKKNSAFVLPDGTILAWGKRGQPGDLTTLGVSGGNNYSELWRARRVYGTPA